MNLKIKATPQKVYFSSLIFLVFINIITLFFVYQFLYQYVYKSMFMSREELLQQSNIKVEDIDLDKFENVVKSIKEKQIKKDVKVDHDIFY